MKHFKEAIKDKKFKWIYGAIGWPATEVKGYVCVVGSCYFQGYERPKYYLISESENRGIKDLCRDILDIDARWSPEVWLADKENDAALAVLHKLNDELKVVLAGVQYEIGQAPWNRRIISISSSALFEMSNGCDFALSQLNDLISERNLRLYLPKGSKAVERLRTIEWAEKMTWADSPVLTALGVVVYELEQVADNEQGRRIAPPVKKYDRLRQGIYKS